MRKKVKWWQFTLALMMNKQITEPVSDKQMNCFVLNEIAALFLSSSVYALLTSTEYADDDKRYHLQINNVAILQQLDILRSPEISRSFLWLLSAIVYWFFEWHWNLALEKIVSVSGETVHGEDCAALSHRPDSICCRLITSPKSGLNNDIVFFSHFAFGNWLNTVFRVTMSI